MTENAELTSFEGEPLELAHPATGELVNVLAPAPELLAVIDGIEEHLERVHAFRRELEAELVRRVDATGARTADVDGCKLEVNPPTEDVYTVEAIRRELTPLEQAGTIEPGILHALIRYSTPPPPRPAVDKRVVNTLKSSDNTELLAALARARQRRNLNRTVKVKSRPTEATATEEAGA